MVALNNAVMSRQQERSLATVYDSDAGSASLRFISTLFFLFSTLVFAIAEEKFLQDICRVVRLEILSIKTFLLFS